MPPFQHPEHNIQLPDGGVMALGRQATVMGILNVTPDSFSDGGEYQTVHSALAHTLRMIADGADIIDVGGESTRPGFDPVTVSDELSRVIPVIEALRSQAIARPVSIDTTKAEVAARAIQAGASIINDVSGLNHDREIAAVAVQYNVPLILMHWDKDRDTGRDIIGEIKRYFWRAIEVAEMAGVGKNRIILDPGFGFAKSLAENYQILREFSALHDLGYPLLAGTSRKSMIGKLLDATPSERIAGTVATTVIAYCAGAHIFRVHDVRANRDALRVAEAALYGVQT
ncbi:MAG: dihydropteroate synthase [Devosia sp.]|nr:dihydropteroate synthase [Devosia sp.]